MPCLWMLPKAEIQTVSDAPVQFLAVETLETLL